MAAGIAMKEAVFCSNGLKELEFDARFESVPQYIDNTSALRVAGKRTYRSRVWHKALLFFGKEMVKEGRVTGRYCGDKGQASSNSHGESI